MNSQTKPDNDSTEQEQPFLAHLIELRDRLLRVVIAVVLIFLALFYLRNEIYEFLAAPLMAYLPGPMIATEVASSFLTPVKLTFMVAIFIGIPYILYQVWGFVAPGLYRHERQLAWPLLVSSVLLFYLGMAFAYFVVFPLAFGFLTAAAPDGVQVMTDIGSYLDFVLALFFAFGIAFEVPIATIIVVIMGLTTPDDLVAKRPYIIVGAFALGMLLTPPDVMSQFLLAIPVWLLFEVGVVMSRLMLRRRAAAEQAAQTSAVDEPPTEEELDEEFERAVAEEERLNTASESPGQRSTKEP